MSLTTHRSRCIFAAIGLAVLSVTPAFAGVVTVTLTPSDTSVIVGDSIHIRVEIDAVPDLKGFSLVYRYDPTRLSFLGKDPGGVLTSTGGFADFLLPDDAVPEDSVRYDAAVLVGTGSGPGVLVFLHFKAIGEGDAAIECELADLRDSENQQTLPPCSDARVSISGPTPVKAGTWGSLKVRHR